MAIDIGEIDDVAILLKRWRSGDGFARDRIFDILYTELRRLSSSFLVGNSKVSLSPGDLVNEATMRLLHLDEIDWRDKAHFMAMASRMMRRVLIDYIRMKNADKRGHQKVTLITANISGANEFDGLLLDQALIRLGSIDPDRVEIIEMRYFGGLSLEEIAAVKGVSLSSIKRNWRSSRAWLIEAMVEAKKLAEI